MSNLLLSNRWRFALSRKNDQRNNIFKKRQNLNLKVNSKKFSEYIYIYIYIHTYTYTNEISWEFLIFEGKKEIWKFQVFPGSKQPVNRYNKDTK